MQTRQTKAASIRVIAPARLHLGFLDLNGSLGRRYGSIGLAIDSPLTDVTLRAASETSVEGHEPERTGKLLQRFKDHFGIDGEFAISVAEAIPAHAGLGSGTQLALAIGTALLNMAEIDQDPRALGELVDRGARSAIGMASFADGGFIIDGGRGEENKAPPVTVQLPFPDDWRILLVLDNTVVGVHGDRETKAFATLREFPESTAAHLCHLAMMRLLPGLAEKDISRFGDALTEIQTVVGRHFAGAQGGGIWTSSEVAKIVRKMGDLGAVGLGQSSWGPTGFAFAESPDAANKLFSTLDEEARGLGLKIVIVRGRNSGAIVTADE